MKLEIDVNDVETDFRIWKSWASDKNEKLYFDPKNRMEHYFYHDVDTAEYLSKYFKGYIFNWNTFDPPLDESKSRICISVKELETLLTEKSKDNDLYLYMITYYPSFPVYSFIHPDTFDVSYLDKPEIRSGHWRLRFSEVQRVNNEKTVNEEKERLTKVNLEAYEIMKSRAYFQCLDTSSWKDPNINIGE